jgi:hypothetical protein
MTAFLNDTFSGAGALSTPNWVKSSYDPLSEGLSKYQQSAGYLYCPSTPSVFAMYNGTPPSADYVVEARVLFNAVANSQSVMLGLRGVNVAHGINGYYAELSWTDATHVGAIISAYGGSQLNGSGFVPYAVTSAASFIANFQVVGTTLSLSLNGTQVWTGTSSLLSAAGVPWIFLNFGVATTDVQLDYFTATSLTVPDFWTAYIGTTETT